MGGKIFKCDSVSMLLEALAVKTQFENESSHWEQQVYRTPNPGTDAAFISKFVAISFSITTSSKSRSVSSDPNQKESFLWHKWRSLFLFLSRQHVILKGPGSHTQQRAEITHTDRRDSGGIVHINLYSYSILHKMKDSCWSLKASKHPYCYPCIHF